MKLFKKLVVRILLSLQHCSQTVSYSTCRGRLTSGTNWTGQNKHNVRSHGRPTKASSQEGKSVMDSRVR